MNGLIDSHVQITKGILKNFSHLKETNNKGFTNKEKYVHYYDFNSNEIKHESIKTLGTVEGYFTEEMEQFLSKEIEGKIGNISKKIKDLNKGKEIEIENKDFCYLINFMIVCVLRCEMYRKKIGIVLEHTIEKYSIKSPQELALFTYPEVSKDLIEIWDLKNRFAKLLHIRVEREFVIPRNVFYFSYTESFGEALVFPITPKTAVIWVLSEYRTGEIQSYIDTEEIVDDFNESAYLYEKVFNDSFIVGSISELSRIRLYDVYDEK